MKRILIVCALLASNYAVFEATTKYGEQMNKVKSAVAQGKDMALEHAKESAGLAVGGLAVAGIWRVLRRRRANAFPKFDHLATVGKVHVTNINGKGLYQIVWEEPLGQTAHMIPRSVQASGPADLHLGKTVMVKTPFFGGRPEIIGVC
jgi:hypothetical protein